MQNYMQNNMTKSITIKIFLNSLSQLNMINLMVLGLSNLTLLTKLQTRSIVFWSFMEKYH